MPSGAKKRKAAKKHKQNLTNTHHSPTNSLQGNDEKESDSGEVSSPTTFHERQLGQEEEEQRDSLISIESGSIATVSDNRSMEGSQSGHGGDEVVEIVRDFKSLNEEDEVVVEKMVIEGNSEIRRTVSIEFAESVKQSKEDSESSSSSSGSSSDGESGSVEKKKELEEVKEENCNLVNETKIVVDSNPIEKVDSNLIDKVDPVEEVVPLSEEVTQVVEVAPVEKIGDSSVIDSSLIESEEKTLPTSGSQGFEISNGVEHHTEYETAERSDNQQQGALARPMVQPTSWTSCCGLFDVLKGSNR